MRESWLDPGINSLLYIVVAKILISKWSWHVKILWKGGKGRASIMRGDALKSIQKNLKSHKQRSDRFQTKICITQTGLHSVKTNRPRGRYYFWPSLHRANIWIGKTSFPLYTRTSSFTKQWSHFEHFFNVHRSAGLFIQPKPNAHFLRVSFKHNGINRHH